MTYKCQTERNCDLLIVIVLRCSRCNLYAIYVALFFCFENIEEVKKTLKT